MVMVVAVVAGPAAGPVHAVAVLVGVHMHHAFAQLAQQVLPFATTIVVAVAVAISAVAIAAATHHCELVLFAASLSCASGIALSTVHGTLTDNLLVDGSPRAVPLEVVVEDVLNLHAVELVHRLVHAL